MVYTVLIFHRWKAFRECMNYRMLPRTKLENFKVFTFFSIATNVFLSAIF